MKEFIPHGIMTLNEYCVEDPVMMMAFQHIFVWANEMGLKGTKVFNLRFKQCDKTNNPCVPFGCFGCLVECTSEQRKIWEENKELRIQKFIKDMLE
jgi:hypothetical protein